MSWQRPQKTVKYVMAPYTEGGRYKNVPILRSHPDSSAPESSGPKGLVRGPQVVRLEGRTS